MSTLLEKVGFNTRDPVHRALLFWLRQQEPTDGWIGILHELAQRGESWPYFVERHLACLGPAGTALAAAPTLTDKERDVMGRLGLSLPLPRPAASPLLISSGVLVPCAPPAEGSARLLAGARRGALWNCPAQWGVLGTGAVTHWQRLAPECAEGTKRFGVKAGSIGLLVLGQDLSIDSSAFAAIRGESSTTLLTEDERKGRYQYLRTLRSHAPALVGAPVRKTAAEVIVDVNEAGVWPGYTLRCACDGAILTPPVNWFDPPRCFLRALEVSRRLPLALRLVRRLSDLQMAWEAA